MKLSPDLSLNPIDRRLASRLHMKQIDAVRYSESIGVFAEREIDTQVEMALSTALGGRGEVTPERRERAVEALQSIGSVVGPEMIGHFRRLALWSHRKSVHIFARSIPRIWFRSIAPEVVLFGERIEIPQEPGDDEDEDGPTYGKGERLSDAEWEALLSELIFPAPTQAAILAILEQPIGGKTTVQRLNELSRLIDDPGRVVDEMVRGIADGENLQKISKRLYARVDGVKASARRIARTEGLRVVEQMNRQALEPMQDMMVGMQVIASLDQNTRPHHAHRHGTIYYYDRRRKPTIDELPDLPDEPNCRCWSTPAMKPPEGFADDPDMRAMFANAAGDSIPDPGVYTDWFRDADLSARKLAVGSRRYRTMQKQLGEIEPEWPDFITPEGRLLKVDEIEAETPRERTARKSAVLASISRREDLISQIAQRGFVELVPGKRKRTKLKPPNNPAPV
ncbi:hypothetical protein GYB59_21640 [bacterium]|nr:hypothetical protein [bacterium]